MTQTILFALIFHTGTVTSQEALTTRNAAARDWALNLQREGILRFAAPLEPEATLFTRDGPAPVASNIASVLIIEAPDAATLMRRLQTHPGLAFGTTIEVRALKPTAPPR